MSLTDEAVRLADLMKVDGKYATADSGTVRPPCLLIEPHPARTYDPALCDGDPFTVAWRVVALVQPPANLKTVRTLESLTDHAVSVLSDAGLVPRTAVPGLYSVSGGDPLPAMILTLEGGQTWLS